MPRHRRKQKDWTSYGTKPSEEGFTPVDADDMERAVMKAWMGLAKAVVFQAERDVDFILAKKKKGQKPTRQQKEHAEDAVEFLATEWADDLKDLGSHADLSEYGHAEPTYKIVRHDKRSCKDDS